jgi:hypothetical protein
LLWAIDATENTRAKDTPITFFIFFLFKNDYTLAAV